MRASCNCGPDPRADVILNLQPNLIRNHRPDSTRKKPNKKQRSRQDCKHDMLATLLILELKWLRIARLSVCLSVVCFRNREQRPKYHGKWNCLQKSPAPRVKQRLKNGGSSNLLNSFKVCDQSFRTTIHVNHYILRGGLSQQLSVNVHIQNLFCLG